MLKCKPYCIKCKPYCITKWNLLFLKGRQKSVFLLSTFSLKLVKHTLRAPFNIQISFSVHKEGSAANSSTI